MLAPAAALLVANTVRTCGRVGRLSLASTAAYEPPSVERAWQAFLAHLPTILLFSVVGALGLILCILPGVAVSLVVLAVAVCTCGLGALVAVPVSTHYLQNAAYQKGVLS